MRMNETRGSDDDARPTDSPRRARGDGASWERHDGARRRARRGGGGIARKRRAGGGIPNARGRPDGTTTTTRAMGFGTRLSCIRD